MTREEPELEPGAVSQDLIERLQTFEGAPSAGTFAELACRRAREALERALDEARTVRLKAIEDARATRERELAALMESVRELRRAAEMRAESLLAAAEIEADQARARSRSEADALLAKARQEAEGLRAEAAAVRRAADERLREIEGLEAEFNAFAARLAVRIGLKDRPEGGWWRRLFRRK